MKQYVMYDGKAYTFTKGNGVYCCAKCDLSMFGIHACLNVPNCKDGSYEEYTPKAGDVQMVRKEE